MKRYFHFELAWLKDERFLPKVADIWGQPVHKTDVVDIINIKLKKVQKYFKGWGSNLYGENRKRRAKLKEEFVGIESWEEVAVLFPGMFGRKVVIRSELDELYVDEELSWAQKSHENWVLKGDQNTTYFHKIADGRKRKNTIHNLKDGEVSVEGTEQLLARATSYYKELFGPVPGNLFQLSPDLWAIHEVLDEHDSGDLTRPFQLDEIKHALFSM